MSAKIQGEAVPSNPAERPEARPSADVIPFPLARRRPLIADLASHFLTLPRGRQRVPRFEKAASRLIGCLAELGVAAERAERERAPMIEAVARELERRRREREGRPA